jgi:hypothetical protein
MRETNPGDDNCYGCMVCEKPFRSPLFSISRQFERIIFYEDDRLPEGEVIAAEGIGTYCSQQCLDNSRDKMLAEEKVRATFPGPGPIETCSRCNGPVDMTRFHLVWTEEEMADEWGEFMSVARPLWATDLAVVCDQCAPPPPWLAKDEKSGPSESENEMPVLSTSWSPA